MVAAVVSLFPYLLEILYFIDEKIIIQINQSEGVFEIFRLIPSHICDFH